MLGVLLSEHAMLTTLAALLVAQANPCPHLTEYMLTSDGQCLDLSSGAVSPSATTTTASPFPDWLFDNRRDAYETATAHSRNAGRWVYANRYVLTMREWPYTASADHRTEFAYVDCQTLWVAQESISLTGQVQSWQMSPDEAFNPGSHRSTYGNLCSALGL